MVERNDVIKPTISKSLSKKKDRGKKPKDFSKHRDQEHPGRLVKLRPKEKMLAKREKETVTPVITCKPILGGQKTPQGSRPQPGWADSSATWLSERKVEVQRPKPVG